MLLEGKRHLFKLSLVSGKTILWKSAVQKLFEDNYIRLHFISVLFNELFHTNRTI